MHESNNEVAPHRKLQLSLPPMQSKSKYLSLIPNKLWTRWSKMNETLLNLIVFQSCT